jgi:hypothetical protein
MRKNGFSMAASSPRNQRALSKIIENERGKHDGEPREPDRQAAKMAHIGVECLAAGDGEGNRPKHQETGRRRGSEDGGGMRGI